MLSRPVPTLAMILQAGMAASIVSVISWTVTSTASASSSSRPSGTGMPLRWRTW